MTDSRIKNDECLVQVRAQVMTRDDELVGWVPMGGGGWSAVGLCKRVVASGEETKHEYVIQGERVTDKSVVLNCRLNKDLQYTQATPTFHHWRTEDKKFGLTFQKNSDARSFDNAVKKALEDLLEGSPESTQTNEMDLGDDEVFVTLDLPLGGRKDSSSQSASTTSTTTSSPTQQSPAQEPFISSYHQSNHQHLHRILYVSKPPSKASPSSDKSQSSKSSDTNTSKEDVWVKQIEKNPPIQSKSDKSGGGFDPEMRMEIKDYKGGDSSKDCYVQFAKNNSGNEYHYPQLDSVQSTQRKSSLSSMKKIGADTCTLQPQPPVPCKNKGRRGRKDKKDSGYFFAKKHSRCVYCSKMFVHEENMKGSCEDAPDKVHDCIKAVSCICCARGMLYHCMADADGDYGHPCVCDSSDEDNCKKWTALTFLSFIVPCLWCYWPLTLCHRCGASCGCCGGRHRAA